MAATVTIEEVRAMGVTGPEVIIDGWIDTAAQADACIDGLGLTENQEKSLKLNFIAWQLDTTATGNVSSQSSKSGASISYRMDGALNRYEKSFKAMQGASCLMAFVKADYSVFLDVAAPSYE